MRNSLFSSITSLFIDRCSKFIRTLNINKVFDTLWVAQTGGTVVLKGRVPSQEILNKMASVGRSVNGATAIDTSQVTIG